MSETPHIMLDLETMGTRPGAIIRALGVAKFTVAGGVGETLYFPITSESCERLGMHFDGNTVQWWLAQDAAARAELLKPAVGIVDALNVFSWFCALPPGEKLNVWGCGAGFDPSLIEWAFRAAGIDVPWTHLEVRCYRTLKALFPDTRKREKGAHHALKDAVWQAEHAVSVLRSLGTHGVAALPQMISGAPADAGGVDAEPGGRGYFRDIPPTGPQNFRGKAESGNAES